MVVDLTLRYLSVGGLDLERTFVLYNRILETDRSILLGISQGTGSKPTGRKARGEKTRQAILETAVHIASAEGLEGLTIGRLAAELSMSKSGLFAHFGSKEDLQLATVEAARAVFVREVIQPAFKAKRGLPRLWKLCDIWLSYVSEGVFRGGCFFAAAAAEFDSRPGPVRDRIAEIMNGWLSTLRRAIIEAQGERQFDRGVDPTQLAFEFHALELGANWAFQLYGDKQAFRRARAGILERLWRHSTPSGSSQLPPLKEKRNRARAKK
jgi:AcrR family transcriptional regulator